MVLLFSTGFFVATVPGGAGMAAAGSVLATGAACVAGLGLCGKKRVAFFGVAAISGVAGVGAVIGIAVPVPLLGCALFVLLFRGDKSLWRVRDWPLVLLLALAAGLGILFWYTQLDGLFLSSDTARLTAIQAPLVQYAVLVGAAAANAVHEEFLWRYLWLDLARAGAALHTAPGRTALVVTSVAFGAVHLYAIPNGLLGVALTTAFGVAAAYLRLRSGSLAGVIGAHFIADCVLLTILL